jgi:hypothetical protein
MSYLLTHQVPPYLLTYGVFTYLPMYNKDDKKKLTLGLRKTYVLGSTLGLSRGCQGVCLCFGILRNYLEGYIEII